MKLDYQSKAPQNKPGWRIGRSNAYHLAGQVAAVQLGNRQKDLPAVHFQVAVQPLCQEGGSTGRGSRIPRKYGAMLEGGRLIPDLPYCSFQVVTRQFSSAECDLCHSAFEADVTNMLVGFLAEAKYVALRDGEVFNANLVYLGALRFYGGREDLEIIEEYMEYMVPGNQREREKKLTALFLTAYGFINAPSNWHAITKLAQTLHSSCQAIFTCEELIAIIDPPKLAETRIPVSPAYSNPRKQMNY